MTRFVVRAFVVCAGLVIFSQAAHLAQLPGVAIERDVEVKMRDGVELALVGATMEDVGFDERTTVEAVQGLLRAVMRVLPAAREASLAEVRVGLRPHADELPVIGPLPDAPRVTIATGHYRNGILLAPLTAQIVASYVVDGESDPAFTATTPARFANRT